MSSTNDLNLADLAAHFSEPEAAAEFLEGVRWPNGPVCPHCGNSERAPYRLKSKATKRRLWKCPACRKQFTVMVGTIFESSHIPLNKWLLAFYLLCSSKKGMSAHQLHRSIGITYKSAWFMFHRIRHAMSEFGERPPLTGKVEVDEMYVGRQPGIPVQRGVAHKIPIIALVQRDGTARSFHLPHVTASTLQAAVRRNVDPSAHVMTDGHMGYRGLASDYASHTWVDHGAKEWTRGSTHTQNVESYFANLRRGLTGVYHHVSEAQLKRYLGEFDFRWNTRSLSDGERTVQALKRAEGKRLRYRRQPMRYISHPAGTWMPADE